MTGEMREILLDIQRTVGHVVERFDGLERRFDGLEQRFEGLERRFDGLEQRFDGLEQRFDGLEQRFDGLERRFDGLEQRFDGLERRFDGLEQKQEKLDANMRTLAGQFVAMRESVDRRIEGAVEEMKSIWYHTAWAAQEARRSSDKVFSYSDDIIRHSEDIKDLKARVRSLEDKSR